MANKKPTFTYKHSLLERSPQKQIIDTKVSKTQNLQSSDPETFGNSPAFQTLFQETFDANDFSASKKNTMAEKLALSTWNRVSGSVKKVTTKAGKN